MSVTLYFLRHGQTDCSRDNLFCGAGSDPDLTEAGVSMAESFADYYDGFVWSAIYSSPLRRTRRTAEMIAGRARKRVELREELREIGYGKWEGLSVETVVQNYGPDYQQWLADPAWKEPTGGERAVGVARRAMETVEEIRASHEGNVLVVSHKATIRILVCVLLGIDLGRFRLSLACPVGSLTVVELRSNGPMLRALGESSHLSKALRSLPGS